MRDEQHRYFYTTADELIKALTEAEKQFPGTRLVKNKVGNLAIVEPVDDPDLVYRYLGYVDVHTGEVVRYERGGDAEASEGAGKEAGRKIRSKKAAPSE